MGDLTELAERWRADLAAWAIPAHITAAVADSPWVLPRQVFARRADRLAATPAGPSYQERGRARAVRRAAGRRFGCGRGLLAAAAARHGPDRGRRRRRDAGPLAERAAAGGTPGGHGARPLAGRPRRRPARPTS